MIKSIYLENWKTHQNSTLNFKKGTNLLIGKIGSGKSSIVDAICYGLFGSFPSLNNRKINISELIMFKPVKKEKSILKMEFEYDSKDYVVEREINNGNKSNTAKLYLNDKLIAGPKQTEVNNRISEILNIDYTLFTKIVYSEQNEIDYFLKIQPSKRKEKFDELFGIIHFESIKENTRKLNLFIDGELDKQKALEKQIKSQIDQINITEIKNKLQTAQDKQKELVVELEKLNKEKKIFSEKLKIETRKKEEHTKLNIQINIIKSKLQDIEIQLSALEEYIVKNNYKNTDLEETQKEIESKKLELKKYQEKNKQLEIISKNYNNKIDFYSNEIKKLDARNKQFSEQLFKSDIDLEELEKNIELQNNKINNYKEELIKNNSELTTLNKAIIELTNGFAKCPVCDSELTKEQISKKLIEKKENKEKTTNNINDLKRNILKINTELKKLELTKEKLNNNKLVLEKINTNKQEINKHREILNEIKTKISKLEKTKDLSKFEQEINELNNKLTKIKEYKEKLKNKKEESNKLIEFENKFKENKFNEDEYINFISENKNLELKLNQMSTQQKLYSEIIQENKKNIENYNIQNNKYLLVSEKIKKLNFKKQDITYFLKAIETSQFQLRKVLIDKINSALELIWNKIYPYGDYVSARMKASNDYILEVKTKENEWIRVEGLLSGGERTCAALSIRIAIALTLTDKLGLLILDEPTNNLDEKSVDSLSSIIDKQLPELVDQIFIITHDSQLLLKTENTNKIVIERDKDNDGVSIIECKSDFV